MTDLISSDQSGQAINKLPAYFFRFGVVNCGKSQANNCQVVLDKVWDEEGEDRLTEWPNFSPVSLRWSGIPTTSNLATIQPKREVFCDIGRIQHPDHEPPSSYRGITEPEKGMNKLFFELTYKYFAQWDCLVPGRNYRIQISVFSENADTTTKVFRITWSGLWKDSPEEMFRELRITEV